MNLSSNNISNNIEDNINHILKTGLIIATSAIISTSAIAQKNTSQRNPIQSVPTNNNMVVSKGGYSTSDPFKHIIKGQNTYLGFNLKNSGTNDSGLEYEVITYGEYKSRTNNAIANQIYAESNLIDKLKIQLGRDVQRVTDDGKKLEYVNKTPYNKLSECDMSIARIVTKDINDIDKILSNGKYVNAKFVITPTEYTEIVTEMTHRGYTNLVVPVIAKSKAKGKVPGEEVPILLLFENYSTYKPTQNKSDTKKPSVEPESKIQEFDEKSFADNLEKELRQEIANGRKDIESVKNVQKDYAKSMNRIDSTLKIMNKDIDSLKANSRPEDITTPVNANIYIGGGAEYNQDFQNWIPQANAGVYIGRVSLGGTFGYRDKNIEKYIERYIPNIYREGTGTTEKMNVKFEVMQIGAELGTDIGNIGRNKNSNEPLITIRLNLGPQYTIVRTDTTGKVYQDVEDDAGNTRTKIYPLKETAGQYNYWSGHSTIELKGKYVSAYAGAKIPINSEYHTKPSFFVGAKAYFGNKRRR